MNNSPVSSLSRRAFAQRYRQEREAVGPLLPRLILIEDTRGMWGVDLFALLAGRGYTAAERSRQNVALRLRD